MTKLSAKNVGTLKKVKFSEKEELAKKIADAITLYYARLRGKEQPEGERRFGFWFPAEKEHRYCCNVVLKSGMKDRDTLLRHCRSHVHIAFRFGISSAELLSEVKRIAEAEQQAEEEKPLE